MGTSLTVHPFASLTGYVPQDCPRVLINLDHVGGWGSRVNDVTVLKKCDEAVNELCKELGWEEDLHTLWEATAGSVEEVEAPAARPLPTDKLTEEEALAAEIGKLMQEIDSHLKVSSAGQERLRDELGDKKNESDDEKHATVSEPDKVEQAEEEESREELEGIKGKTVDDADTSDTTNGGKL